MRVRFLSVLFLWLLALPLTALADSAAEPGKPSYRYLVYYNKIDRRFGPDLETRILGVLLEEKAFSPETLGDLFARLKKRFPKPHDLHIRVSTSLEQVATPEEADEPQVSGRPGRKEDDKFPWALYMLDGGDELYRYGRNDREMITVVLSGNRP